MIQECLYPWQKDLVEKLKDKTRYGLYLDMGLGKTPIALSMAEYRNCDKIIVVTIKPKVLETVSTSGSWQQWSTKLNDGSFKIYSKKYPAKPTASSEKEIFIINYEALYKREPHPDKAKSKSVNLSPVANIIADSCKGHRVCLLLDESHKIKTRRSTQSKALSLLKLKLESKASYFSIFLLTGTPFTQGFIDILNQLNLLGCAMNVTQFKDKFCRMGNIRGRLGWQQPIVGYKNIDGLYNLIHKYAVTIKTNDVLKLPPQIFQNHICPKGSMFDYLTKETLTESEIISHTAELINLGLNPLPDDYNFTYKGKKIISPWYCDMGYPDSSFMCDTPATRWMRARQLSIGFQGNEEEFYWYDYSRLNELRKLLEQEPDNYVLFYNYMPEFFKLYELCTKLEYNIDVYNGKLKYLTYYDKYESQSAEDRLVNRKNIILANYASGSTGKNWQLYNHCILFSLPLYKDWEQSIKRVHRATTTEPVIYHIFTNDNWLDKDMKESLDHNVQYSTDLFNKKLNEVMKNGR